QFGLELTLGEGKSPISFPIGAFRADASKTISGAHVQVHTDDFLAGVRYSAHLSELHPFIEGGIADLTSYSKVDGFGTARASGLGGWGAGAAYAACSHTAIGLELRYSSAKPSGSAAAMGGLAARGSVRVWFRIPRVDP